MCLPRPLVGRLVGLLGGQAGRLASRAGGWRGPDPALGVLAVVVGHAQSTPSRAWEAPTPRAPASLGLTSGLANSPLATPLATPQVVFNPKDTNTFASASLDRTVKVGGMCQWPGGRVRAPLLREGGGWGGRRGLGPPRVRARGEGVGVASLNGTARAPGAAGWPAGPAPSLPDPPCVPPGVVAGPAHPQLHAGGPREGRQLRRLLHGGRQAVPHLRRR